MDAHRPKLRLLPRSLSLMHQITGVAMVTTVTVLLVACAAFILQQWAAERADSTRHQQELAAIVAGRLAAPVVAHDRENLADSLRGLAAAPDLREAVLTDERGRTLSSFTAPRYSPAARGGLLQPSPIVTTAPVIEGGRRVATLTLRADAPTLGAVAPRYTSASLQLLMVAAAVAVFLGRPLARRVLEPIAQVSAVMDSVAVGGDFSQRAERLRGGELSRLTDTFNALLVQLEGNDRALRATLADLTVARDEAEAANILKSQFLANMSHEIRTPLNGVLAMAQIMALSEMAPEQAERVEVIRHSGETLLAILNDILDISKIEAGKLELDDVEFDLRALVCAGHAQFKGLAETKGLRYELTVDPSAEGLRRGDAGRLRQILNNLVSNAVKFTGEGEVLVRVEGEGEGGADGLHVTVTDTGIGVSPAKLPLLFQKFTQADSSTTRRFGGTGLGLAICHELAQLMGGRVWAHSEEGAGSTFQLSLPFPRTGEARAGVREDEAIEDQGRLLRVLAAEDNATNQLVLTTILQIFGAELTLVGDGAAAVEAWRAAEFDVVLMDVQMPVMDGVAATRAIREIEAAERRPRTPIVALSANAMVHQVREYLGAGMDGHVAKPIELPKLHAALEAALAMSEALREAA